MPKTKIDFKELTCKDELTLDLIFIHYLFIAIYLNKISFIKIPIVVNLILNGIISIHNTIPRSICHLLDNLNDLVCTFFNVIDLIF